MDEIFEQNPPNGPEGFKKTGEVFQGQEVAPIIKRAPIITKVRLGDKDPNQHSARGSMNKRMNE